MCRRRRYLVASILLLLEALFNHCMGLTASNQRQAPTAPNLVSNDLSSASTSLPCASCAPKTAPAPSSSSSFSSTSTSPPNVDEDSAPPHSDDLVHHYERQLLKRLGLSRRPPSPLPGAVEAISDHMHSLFKRFSEDDEWQNFLWIVGDRRKELGRLTAVRAHRISDEPLSPYASLRFDLSSLVTSDEERPIAGELRLFLNLTGLPQERDVAVYDVMPRSQGGAPLIHLLHQRRLKSPSVSWRSFDVSPALVRWARRPRWRQTGQGQLLLKISKPRRIRRSAGASPDPSRADVDSRQAELFSYYHNSKKRGRRRHSKRKRSQNRKRNRNRKRKRERRRRRKLRQRMKATEEGLGARALRWHQSSVEDEEMDQFSSWPDEGQGSRHEKRNAMVSPDHRQACQRHRMYVDFAEVRWNEWIVAPVGYHAGLCHGDCTKFPLSDYYNTTNHAIIQYLVHANQPFAIPPPCCVAIQLSPKPMLLFDENRNVVLKSYENMIVDHCGCR